MSEPQEAKSEPTTKPYTYAGGLSAIDIKMPSGRWLRVERGESVDLLPNEVKAVKALPDWKATKNTKPIEAPTSAQTPKDEI